MRQFAVVSVLLSSVSLSTLAAITEVEPGSNTLRVAIDNANAGDTLILKDGTYSLTGPLKVNINKDLTLRALNKAASPIIKAYDSNTSFTGFDVTGRDTDLTIQGITLQGVSYGTPVLDLKQIASFTLLESQLVNGSLNSQQGSNSENQPISTQQITIIGSQLTKTYLNLQAEQQIIIAGNQFVGSTQVSLHSGALPTYLIGNDIQGHTINFSLSRGDWQIQANRFDLWLAQNSQQNIAGTLYPPILSLYSADHVNVSNNLMRLGVANVTTAGTPAKFEAIEAISVTQLNIQNNVIDVLKPASNNTKTDYPLLNFGYNGAGKLTVQNNIITHAPYSVFAWPTDQSIPSQSQYNICYSNGVNNCGDGTLTVDPKFAELTNYTLDPLSPALNAGNNDLTFTDIDGSRNDIGVYGGPLNLQQFDIQRDESQVGPYLYPLFDANKSLSVDGNVEIKAVSYARIR